MTCHCRRWSSEPSSAQILYQIGQFLQLLLHLLPLAVVIPLFLLGGLLQLLHPVFQCLAGRHQGNGKAENTGKQLRRAVAKALTLKKGTNWVEVLPAIVRAWHETTGPPGYTPNEIVFGKRNRTKGPPLAEPKGVAQDAAHYFQRREELIALARRAMIQVQETMAHKYNKRRRMSPNFSKGDRAWVPCQRKNLGDKTCPYTERPYEVLAKKAHDLYVIQVDQRRLVDVHVDYLMKTVNSPRCNRCIVADLSCNCEACSLDAPGVVTPDTAPDISEPN